jgi:hypothetical protein
LKTAGGVLIILTMLALGILFIVYLPELSSYVYRYANPASGWVFVADLLALPFAFIRRLRSAVGAVLYISSYLFGIVVWTFSAMLTYAVWGYFGLFFGLVWMGVGVVPMALFAAAIHRQWFLIFMLLGNLMLVFGCRIIGIALQQNTYRRALSQTA